LLLFIDVIVADAVIVCSGFIACMRQLRRYLISFFEDVIALIVDFVSKMVVLVEEGSCNCPLFLWVVQF